MCTLLLLLLSTAGAAAQNVLTKIPIPATSAGGQVVVNKVLNRVYVSADFTSGGTLTVIDGKTLTVLTHDKQQQRRQLGREERQFLDREFSWWASADLFGQHEYPN